MPKPSNNLPAGDQLKWKGELEQSRLKNLKHQKNIGAPVQPMAASRPRPTDPNAGESDWGRQLERGRMKSSAIFNRIGLPGPGAAAAVGATAVGKPLRMPASGGKKGGGVANALANPQAPSSAETAKVAAQVASGVGLAKIAGDEAKKALKAAGKGLIAGAGAVWQIINKYGPWFLFFGFFAIVAEEPFLTAPIILTVLWVWLIAAHWLKIKWLRKFNILEVLVLIVSSVIYMVAFILILLMFSMVACAFDPTCRAAAVDVIGLGTLMDLL